MVSCESARAGIEGSEHDDDDMSLQVSAMLEKTDWVEELQRKVFEECAAQSQQKANLLPAEDSDALENVPVSVIVGNIHQNFAKIPHFRQRTDFLEELRESLQRVAKDNQVNWYEFKDSSASWFLNLLNLVREDGNNNVRQLNHSDAPAEDSEKDRLSMEERSCSDAIDDDYLNSYSLNQMDTAASCYSLNSSSMGVGTTDSTMESSEEGDHISENIAGVDLKVRIRRYNEETANLKEELLRTEETNSILERDIKSLQSSLEQMTNKFSKLQKDFREQRDMLVETEQREESCKLDLRKLEKANAALQKKMEALEKENKNILNLKAKIDEITKKNAELLRQIADYKGKYNAKTLEFEYLQEEYNDLQNKNSQLEKSYEKKFEHYQEKIQELQSLNAELQSRMNKSNTSSEMSFTPPPYNSINAQIHSTPYNNHKNRHHDSLYSELKASGFTIDDAKIQDLKEELSFYNEEIYIISQQADEALQDIAALKNEICVPSVQLVEMDNIQTLKHKITTLVNMVKTCTAIKAPSALRMGDESREKPDVLPETTKTMSCLANERLFASEKQENDLIGSVTSGMTPVPQIRLRETCDKSTSPLRDVTDIQTENSEASKIQPETIVPIAEALKRINEIKAADDEEDVEAIRRPSRIPRQKSVYTNKNTDWHHLLTEASKSKAACFTKNINNRLNSETFNNAKGDGSHRELLKPKKLNSLSSYIHSTTDMKTLKSESKDYTASPEEIIKIDAKYVTIRPKLNEETYSVSPTVSSTEGKSDFEQSKLDDVKSINSTFVTPVSSAKFIPRRKLSVYHRSFDVDSLQTSDSLQISTSEKRRSISTPDGQETDLAGLRAKSIQPLEPSMAKSELLITYRSTNISDSSDSPSPQKSSLLKDEESTQEPPAIIKTIILAPSKLKLPDSIVNQTLAIEPEIENSKSSISQSITSQPIIFQSTFPKNHYSFGRLSGEGTEQSRILSSSENLIRKEKNNLKNNGVSITLASCNVGSSTALSNVSAVNTSSNSVNGLNMSDNIVLRNIEKNDKTYLKKSVDTDETRKSDATAALNASTTSVATDSVLEEISLHYSSSGGGANGGGVDVVGDKSNGDVPTVERAMSSGEDSSADSECDARSPEKTAAVPTVTAEEAKKPPAIGVDSSVKPVLGRINDVCSKENGRKRMDDVALREDKVEKPQTTNRKEKENSCQKVTSNSSPIEVIKEDESPKAFPSWTDEKLHESGIASLVEIDAEISENLSEEELKKKYTAFSVGLSTDRMTLSKRIILSRRHRDQAEKNFTNEVLKMQQDIKDLPRQRNSVSGRVPGLRRPSLCYEAPKWEIEKLDRTDSSSSIAELRDIFEQAESRRHSREENNNNLIRTSINNLSTIASEHVEEEEVWSNSRDDIVPHLANDNEVNSLELGQHHRHPLVCWLSNRYAAWRSTIWGIFIAFILGFFINKVVSSSSRSGPPVSWWSIEEILNQYIQVENEKQVRRPI